MGYYIDHNARYYEGDKIRPTHIEVTKRPSPYHEWLGAEWSLSVTQYKVKIKEEVPIKIKEHFLDKILIRDKKDKKITKWLDDSDVIIDQFDIDIEAAKDIAEIDTLLTQLYIDLGVE